MRCSVEQEAGGEVRESKRGVGLIDTHAHATFPEFDADRSEVLARAWSAGLEAIVAVGAGAGLVGNARAIELAHGDARIFATVGIHPHDAGQMAAGWREQVEEMARDERVVAVGEIGLDYHHRHASPEAQRTCFRELLAIADRVGKPVVIHDREAHEEVWGILEEVGVPRRGGVFHCFSGDVAFAERIARRGFYLSITGVVTFPKARELHEVVAATPLERLVLETDCPYLTPEPYRGQRNEPARVAEVARRVAEIKGLAVEDVARVTTLNAKRLFGLPGAEMEPHIAYRIRNSLYLNITNRCNLACRFCPKFADLPATRDSQGLTRDLPVMPAWQAGARRASFEVKGYYLRLDHEPDVDEVFLAIGQPERYDEVVFCGYGEPTLRLEVLKVIAKRMKEQGVRRVRLNTDGLANLVYGRDILPELAGLVDAISVSLNAADAATYAANCPSKHREAAYDAVCAFIRGAKRHIPEVVASVVALPGLDLDACRRKADELGVPLRVREYMNVG